MKITKKSSVDSGTSIPVKPEVTEMDYTEACDKIKCAIDILGKSAKSDVLARESIANLGVVLLDLSK